MSKKSVLGSLFGREETELAERGRALMVVGTASHVGKSWMTTAICRSLKRRGFNVAPFKGQNMSLNSFVCADGGEIGRSQAAQAEACGVEPTTDMNPVLLKPSGPAGCQVIVNGRVRRDVANPEQQPAPGRLLPQIESAYKRLSQQHDFIVMEGSGGIAELNLANRDVANLPLAHRLGVPALLVADIERGGVFASIVGALMLTEPPRRELIQAVAVNRFRGDLTYFGEGRTLLEDRSKRPCIGVFPHDPSIHLDAEDSVSLDERLPAPRRTDDLRICVVRLPHISNTTDFRLMPSAEYITEATPDVPDLIIIPGTKNTLEDLFWLKRIGLDRWILDMRKEGTAIWGVCGGFQMLGRFVSDPSHVESTRGRLAGLGILPHQTELLEKKTTRQVQARLPGDEQTFEAYEIHMGESTPALVDAPFSLVDDRPEGFFQRGILGTYLHGAFEDKRILNALLGEVARWRSKRVPDAGPIDKEADYDKLADWFERHVDQDKFEELYLP